MRSASRSPSRWRWRRWARGQRRLRGSGAGDVRLHAAHRALPDGPEPDLDYDLIVVCDCGDLQRVGRVLDRARRAVRPGAHRGHRPPRLQPRLRCRRLGGRRRRPRPARWSRCCCRAWASARRADGRHRGRPDGRHGHRHGQLPAPQHHAAHARAWQRAAGRRRAAGRDRAAHLSHQAQRPAAAVRARPGAPGGVGRRPARLVDPGRRRPGRAPGAGPQMSEGLIDLLAQSRRPRSPSSSRTRATGRASASAPATAAWTPSALTGAFGGGGHARAAGATIELPIGRGPAAVLARPRRLLAAELPSALTARARRATARLDGILVVGQARRTHVPRRGGPRAPPDRRAARRPRRHAGPVRMGVLPVFLGHATRWSSTTSPMRRPTVPGGLRRHAPRPTTSTAS